VTNLLQTTAVDDKDKDESPDDKEVDGDNKKDDAGDDIKDADYESSEDTPLPEMA
jgi:hypothetical protein